MTEQSPKSPKTRMYYLLMNHPNLSKRNEEDQGTHLNHQGMGGGIVGRNNQLSFSETKMGPLIDLVVSDSNGASLRCVRQRAVCPCDKPPVRGLVR